MRAQMKRLFAVLLTVLLVVDSQSAPVSSLTSFATGTRSVQAADQSAEASSKEGAGNLDISFEEDPGGSEAVRTEASAAEEEEEPSSARSSA